MLREHDVMDLMRKRYSCRTFDGQPVAAETQAQLQAFLEDAGATPFGFAPRLAWLAATEDDQTAVRRLGTYGFIKGATAYIAGAVKDAARPGVLEDFGYLVECAVLYATQLGLGTVWLGGTFTKSRFVRALGLRSGESLPAVIAVGNIAGVARAADAVIRRGAQADKRLSWEQLFYDAPAGTGELFGTPLSREAAGPYATVLDMVRIAPSASNKQPWRIVREGASWHLVLQRSGKYRNRNRIVGVADMQRIDMGIAMCHLELAARQLGLAGTWTPQDPQLPMPGPLTLHVATWVEGSAS